MRVTTKAVFDIESGDLLDWEGYDYEGPVELAGGGPSAAQKAAQAQQLSNAQQEGKLANQSADKFRSLYADLNPYYTNQMTNGLPFYGDLTDFSSGFINKAYNPVRADFLRRSSTMGALPSGFKAAGLNDINEAAAHDFDSQLVNNAMMNYQAKQAGAAGKAGLMQIVNPAAFYGGSTSAAGGASQPLQPAQNPWMSILGGAAQGASSAIPWSKMFSKIPF